MFLALTFRPMDSHCVHIDASSPPKVRQAMENVIKCYKHKFPEANIFSVKFPIHVYWGKFILEVGLKTFAS